MVFFKIILVLVFLSTFSILIKWYRYFKSVELKAIKHNHINKDDNLRKDSRLLLIAFKTCVFFSCIVTLANNLYSSNHVLLSILFLSLKSDNIHKTYVFIIVYYVNSIVIVVKEDFFIFLLMWEFLFCIIFLLVCRLNNYEDNLNDKTYYTSFKFYTVVIFLFFIKNFIDFGISGLIIILFIILIFLKVLFLPSLLKVINFIKNNF